MQTAPIDVGDLERANTEEERMNQPLAVLKRTEGEIAALLVGGLATRRGGREQLEELAGEVSALKMERLAVELRNLAQAQDPAAAANSAFTALAMARKLQERLTPLARGRPEGGHPLRLRSLRLDSLAGRIRRGGFPRNRRGGTG